jgi:hypothetical protein
MIARSRPTPWVREFRNSMRKRLPSRAEIITQRSITEKEYPQ